jgi:hypothetical protein
MPPEPQAGTTDRDPFTVLLGPKRGRTPLARLLSDDTTERRAQMAHLEAQIRRGRLDEALGVLHAAGAGLQDERPLIALRRRVAWQMSHSASCAIAEPLAAALIEGSQAAQSELRSDFHLLAALEPIQERASEIHRDLDWPRWAHDVISKGATEALATALMARAERAGWPLSIQSRGPWERVAQVALTQPTSLLESPRAESGEGTRLRRKAFLGALFNEAQAALAA